MLNLLIVYSCHYLQVRQEEGEGGERYFVNMFTGLAWYVCILLIMFVFVLLFITVLLFVFFACYFLSGPYGHCFICQLSNEIC